MSNLDIRSRVVHVIGWGFIIAGIVMWLTGTWGSPIVFLIGLIVEGVGYLVVDRASRRK